MSGTLYITRHGESEWNAKGVWTGSTDVHLSEKGFKEAALLGELLKDARIDYAYCSQQIRALETLEGILDASGKLTVNFERTGAINERDYGVYTGKNKWQVKEEIGEEAFENLRRGWEAPVRGGETLKDVYTRAVPFYTETVLPRLLRGQNVLIVAHGNSIRSLVKYIESVSDENISDVEMIFGQILIYTVNEDGTRATKEIGSIDSAPPPA